MELLNVVLFNVYIYLHPFKERLMQEFKNKLAELFNKDKHETDATDTTDTTELLEEDEPHKGTLFEEPLLKPNTPPIYKLHPEITEEVAKTRERGRNGKILLTEDEKREQRRAYMRNYYHKRKMQTQAQKENAERNRDITNQILLKTKDFLLSYINKNIGKLTAEDIDELNKQLSKNDNNTIGCVWLLLHIAIEMEKQ